MKLVSVAMCNQGAGHMCEMRGMSEELMKLVSVACVTKGWGTCVR